MKVALTGQVALVHGDGPWGGAIAARLADCGAHVVRAGMPAEICREAGRLDILVNADAKLMQPLDDPPFPAVGSAMQLCSQAAAVMATGRIVNLGSIFGIVPSRGAGGLSAACAALFAQTRALALDLAPCGIRVNAIAALGEQRPHTPLARAARPADVAGAVLFLLASASSYVVGEVLRVDGGWSVGFAREF